MFNRQNVTSIVSLLFLQEGFLQVAFCLFPFEATYLKITVGYFTKFINHRCFVFKRNLL